MRDERTWTPFQPLPEGHRLYGRTCGVIGRATNWEPCRLKAKYFSTLGHLAVVRCERCFQRAKEHDHD